MHARLSTACNYEITLDPLYASIIIAFYASARGETTTNFSVGSGVARARKVVLHFSRFALLLSLAWSSLCSVADKPSSLLVTVAVSSR